MTAWPPRAHPGLYVDLGEHSRPWAPERGVWIRPPYAELRCPAGCEHYAYGALEVPFFLARLDHLTHPGPPDDRSRDDRPDAP